MSYPTRSLPGHIRGPSVSGSLNAASSVGQPSSLQARVNEKKAELENLKELRELSAAVANQMEALEQKLGTLSDGTEAIALVVGNWHNVLRAINMASAKLSKPQSEEATIPLPQTLVRIPTEHAPNLQAHTDAVAAEEEDRSNTTQ